MGVSFSTVRSATQFKALTTLTLVQFENLTTLFSATYQKRYEVSIEEAQRNLEKEFVFPTAKDLLFYTLYCIKNDMIGAARAFTFGITESSADYNFKKGITLLHATLAENDLLPARHFESEAAFLDYFKAEGKLIIDATEFKIQRPAENEKQKEMYSGKKKIHSKKSLVISNPKGTILYVSYLFSGKTHDYELLKQEIPPAQKCLSKKELWLDLGFMGIKKDYHIENLHIPHKKKRVKKGACNDLTPAQKEENKVIGRERVVIEHSIGELKKCRILQQTIRIKKQDCLENLVGIAASLANFRKRK
jgi:DDE superfamily endonuclease